MISHFVSASCAGERCRCGSPATHKVGEEVPHDDPSMRWSELQDQLEDADHTYRYELMTLNEYELPDRSLEYRVDDIKSQIAALTPEQHPRHELTAYVCCNCFTALLGPATGCPLQITPITETQVDAPSREPDWSKPSLAVVASDGNGNGCVVHQVGPHIEHWANDAGRGLKDLGLGDAPLGISIWEGKIVGSTDYWGESDAWLEGAFRAPTEEEWDCINGDDNPWNDDEWYCEPGQCCRRDHNADGNCDVHVAPGKRRLVVLR